MDKDSWINKKIYTHKYNNNVDTLVVNFATPVTNDIFSSLKKDYYLSIAFYRNNFYLNEESDRVEYSSSNYDSFVITQKEHYAFCMAIEKFSNKIKNEQDNTYYNQKLKRANITFNYVKSNKSVVMEFDISFKNKKNKVNIVTFSHIDFIIFGKIIEDLKIQSQSIHISLLNTHAIERSINGIKTIGNISNNTKNEIRQINSKINRTNKEIETETDIDIENTAIDLEDNSIEMNEEDNTNISDFDDFLSSSDFQEIEAEIKNEMSINEKSIKEDSNQFTSFISVFLKNNLMSYVEWASAIQLVGEKSKSNLFCPTKTIINFIEDSNNEHIFDREFYLYQLYLIYNIKKTIREDLSQNSDSGTPFLPTIKNSKIKELEGFKLFLIEMLSSFGIYSAISKMIASKVDDEFTKEKYRHTNFVIKNIISPFLIFVRDDEEFIELCKNMIDRLINSGVCNDILKEYKDKVGKNYNIQSENIINFIKSMMQTYADEKYVPIVDSLDIVEYLESENFEISDSTVDIDDNVVQELLLNKKIKSNKVEVELDEVDILLGIE